jgi:hypothetical protein
MLAPEPSPDGLAIYGAVDLSIVVVTRDRPDQPFGAPTTIVPGNPTTRTILLGSPELSQDCRSLYYVHVGASAAPAIHTIRVVRR